MNNSSSKAGNPNTAASVWDEAIQTLWASSVEKELEGVGGFTPKWALCKVKSPYDHKIIWMLLMCLLFQSLLIWWSGSIGSSTQSRPSLVDIEKDLFMFTSRESGLNCLVWLWVVRLPLCRQLMIQIPSQYPQGLRPTRLFSALVFLPAFLPMGRATVCEIDKMRIH